MAEKHYTIGTEGIVADGELSDYANTTLGETVSFEFYIRDMGHPGYGDSLGNYYGGSQTAANRYNQLKEYLKYAGYAQVDRTMGSVYFTEPLDYSRADIDSLLVPIYPAGGIQEARGVWGVIVGGEDSTQVFGSLARIDLEVFVLAEYSEFDTEEDVRDAFESQL